MGERRLLSIVLGALFVALCMPAFASATTYNWDQPGDFTTSGTGANPDHDAYGGRPWSYEEGPTCRILLCTPSHDPSGFTPLPNFASGTWSDTASRFISSSGGALKIGAIRTGVTALGWQNPLGHQADVSVTGSLTAGNGTCAWSLDQDGAAVTGGSGAGSFSQALTVPAGGSIYLTTDSTSLIPGASCTDTATLDISESESPGSPTGSTSITLNSPGSGPSTNSSPTLTGQSGGDSSAVTLSVYSGSAATGTPARTLTASRNLDTGEFSATITPALPDGQYTVIAAQSGSAAGQSNPVTFRIKANAPALTIGVPTRGGHAFGPEPTFSGRAGTVLGDAPIVALVLHRGSSASGAIVGVEFAAVSAGAWSLKWAEKLADGFYTLVATQVDDAGHTTTQTTPFVVVPTPPVIGPRVALRGTTASVAITCIAPSGTCVGSVLALTAKRLRTRAGGPVGYVRVLYDYAKISAGKTVAVRTRLPSYVAAALHRAPKLQVKVTVAMIGIGRTLATRPVAG